MLVQQSLKMTLWTIMLVQQSLTASIWAIYVGPAVIQYMVTIWTIYVGPAVNQKFQFIDLCTYLQKIELQSLSPPQPEIAYFKYL